MPLEAAFGEWALFAWVGSVLKGLLEVRFVRKFSGRAVSATYGCRGVAFRLQSVSAFLPCREMRGN